MNTPSTDELFRNNQNQKTGYVFNGSVKTHFIDSFFSYLIPLDKAFVICASRSPHVFPDRLDGRNL